MRQILKMPRQRWYYRVEKNLKEISLLLDIEVLLDRYKSIVEAAIFLNLSLYAEEEDSF